jgi:hypothetical protein
MGYQIHWHYDYLNPIDSVLFHLEPLKRTELIAEWRRCRPEKAHYADEQIMSLYTPMVLDEIVKRAKTAAYRTIKW